ATSLQPWDAHHRLGAMILRRLGFTAFLVAAAALGSQALGARQASEHHYLYVAEPGIRNYVEYGGVGILVYDMDRGYAFVRRIPSQAVPAAAAPENVKGFAGSAATGRRDVTTDVRTMAFELANNRKLWDRVD